jgi:hypothetical protein
MKTIKDVKKLSPKTLLKIIDRVKKYLKSNKVVKDMFKDHDVDINVIDNIPMYFADLDVSGKTKYGVIIFNYKLLCSDNYIKNIAMYATHEILHYLQQCYGSKPVQGAADGDYLSNPAEEDAFQEQIRFIDDEFGFQEANNYTEHLLNHHNKSGDERDELKEVLMGKVDE